GPLATLGEGGKAYCVRVLAGPAVITDLHSSSACPGELFALGGNVAEPRWIIHGPAGTAMNISGGVLAVREHEYFVVVAAATIDAKLRKDVRCGVTWSAWKSQPATFDEL